MSDDSDDESASDDSGESERDNWTDAFNVTYDNNDSSGAQGSQIRNINNTSFYHSTADFTLEDWRNVRNDICQSTVLNELMLEHCASVWKDPCMGLLLGWLHVTWSTPTRGNSRKEKNFSSALCCNI